MGVSHAGERNDNPLGARQMHSYPHDKCSLAESGVCTDQKAPSLLLLVVLSLCGGVYVGVLWFCEDVEMYVQCKHNLQVVISLVVTLRNFKLVLPSWWEVFQVCHPRRDR